MPHEIYDASQALCNDYIAPLFDYKFGEQVVSIFPSSALEGQASFAYVESQLYASAVATEYEELRKQSQETIDKSSKDGMTRELACEYASLLKQMNEKSVELDTWTLKYVEAMAKLEAGEFEHRFLPELNKFNEANSTKLSFSKLVNNLYQKINETLKTITVETPEEEEAKLYSNSDDENPDEENQDEGKREKISPIEQELKENISNTANGSLTAVSSSSNTSESLVQLV